MKEEDEEVLRGRQHTRKKRVPEAVVGQAGQIRRHAG